MPAIMKTAELQPGMQGTAYTVVDASQQIKTFAVRITGVLDQGKGSSPMIMAEVSGPVVDAAGGIVSGMSGSPVYVQGKLIGAVSRTFKEMDPHTCFITPIEGMLDVWDLPDSKNKTHVQPVDIRKAATERDKARTELEKKKAALEQREAELYQQLKHATVAADKAQTKSAFFVTGFHSSGLSFLQKQLEPFGILAKDMSSVGGNGSGQVVYGAKLSPGSAMGVSVVCGDFSMAATGTATAVDGNRILAFGHSFLHRGNVNYFLTDASVLGTAHGPVNGIKIASSGNIIGRVNQDREMAVSGLLGVFPEVVPIHVTVHDQDMGRSETYNSLIAYDEDFLPNLSASLTYASMDRLMDRLSGSTAKVHFVIRTNAAEGGKIERDNMYYNAADVGQIAVNELGQAMNIICGNTERESNIFDIKVEVTVSGNRRTASLVSAVPDKTKVKPGETVQLKTIIKPYRHSKEVLTIPYTVPRGQRVGPMRLDIRGGGLIPVAQLLLAQQAAAGIDITAEDDKTVSTTAKLKEYLSSDRNNEIIVTASAMPVILSEAEQKAAVRQAVKASSEMAKEPAIHGDKKKTPAQTKYSTDYIIDNVIHAALQVVKK